MGSKRSITTVDAPRRCAPVVQPAGAGVVERRRREVHGVLGEAEHELHQPDEGVGLTDLAPDVRREDALRTPGGARRIEHVGALALVGDGLGRAGGEQGLVVAQAGDRGAHGDAPLGRERDIVAQVGEQLRRAEQQLRPAVVHDVGDLGRVEVPVDRRDVDAGPQPGPHDLEELGAVLEQHRHVVADPEPLRPQDVGDAVRPGLELGVGQRRAGGADGDREAVGGGGRVGRRELEHGRTSTTGPPRSRPETSRATRLSRGGAASPRPATGHRW